ncbi:MAG: class I SAM-dependent methyltransferase [Thioalkalivibrionaceae bacterium]
MIDLPAPFSAQSNESHLLRALHADIERLGLDSRSTPDAQASVTRARQNADAIRLIWACECRRRFHARPFIVCGNDRLSIDFIGGALGWRRAHGGNEALIARLRGLPAGASIIDASAGLGRDAALLIQHGYRVTACERNPWVYLLLRHAHRQWLETEPEIASRLILHFGDVRATLKNTENLASTAAIFDPMFPPGRSKAAVRGGLRVLQRLTHVPASDATPMASIERNRFPKPDSPASLTRERDAAETLAALLTHCAKVVVKRPPQAPPLDPVVVGSPPHHQVPGRTVRFDVYRGVAQLDRNI